MRYTWKQKQQELAQTPTLKGFLDLVCADGDAPAICWLDAGEERTLSFTEMREQASRCAALVEQLGCGERGKWVGLAVDTCWQWPIIFWGLVMAGRKPLLLDAALEGKGLRFLMNHAGTETLIVGRRRNGLADVSQITVGQLMSTFDADSTSVVASVTDEPWADEVAFCTSGTTGTSRIFVYKGDAICLQAITLLREGICGELLAEERGPLRMLCFLPLNHIFGLMVSIIGGWALGYPQIFVANRAPDTILATCRQFKVQIVSTVPLLVNNVCSTLRQRLGREPLPKQELFQATLQYSLDRQAANSLEGMKEARATFSDIHERLFGPDLDLFIVGGGHSSKENLKLINGLGIATLCGYGMTEVGIAMVESNTSLVSRTNGGIGQGFNSTYEFKVIASEDNPEQGELWMRSGAMHSGRLIDGELRPRDVNAEGWYESGDVVYKDDNQSFHVSGRIKDVIIGESGENIFPDEIENSFVDLPGVKEYAVLGVKDHHGKEQVTLVMNIGERYGDPGFMEDLYREIQARNSRLALLKQVRQVIVSSELLPMTSQKKVQRVKLRGQLEKKNYPFIVLNARYRDFEKQKRVSAVKQAEDEAEKMRVPVKEIEFDQQELANLRETVRTIFANVLEMDPRGIGDTSHFIDELGGDSLQSIAISVALEDKFKIDVPPKAFASCLCVEDVARLIYELQHDIHHQQRAGDEEVQIITKFEDTPEYQAFAERLEGLKQDGNPYFVCHESPLLDVSLMDGQEVLNFGSYNYVGMSGRPEVQEAAIEAIRKYGTSASGSRLLAGEKKIHEELERAIAEWKHAEDAVVLVGGHSTNVTFVGNFCGEKDLILYDSLAHNSIAEGCRLSSAMAKAFPHSDVAALETMLEDSRDRFQKILIVVEGAYSMDGDIAPIPELVELKKRYGCFLMVDEAHSAGVLGETGAGVGEYFHLQPNDIDIKMGTLSKSLGTCGGYLAGKKSLIDYLRYQLPGFVFSVGMSPPLAAASLEAIRQLQTHPEIVQNLHRNIRAFVDEARKRNLDICLAGDTAILPVLVGGDYDSFKLSLEQSKHGVFVLPAVYPAVPHNKSRLRYCVTSEHKPEQIARALDILVETSREMGIQLPEGHWD